MAQEKRERKGSFGHRFLTTGLNILLAILVYWLLGFILSDISSQPGPSLTSYEAIYQDKDLLSQNNALNQQLMNVNSSIDELKQQQSLIQASISGYRDTMNQLLSLQKSSVQKGIIFSMESQQNLTKITQQYLESQQQYQKLNFSIASKYTDSQRIQSDISQLNTKLDEQRARAYDAYNEQMVRHNLKLAGLQLCFLLPLLAIVAYFYRRLRQSIYVSMVVAVGVATLIEIIFVMHEHFPSRYFKYLLILALIYLVVCALKTMLRMVIKPQTKWLMKQNRDAYQKMLCATCQYPIAPGLFKLTLPLSKQKDILPRDLDNLSNIEAYICPSCGEKLFEKCSQCQQLRHSLLAYCDHCGFEKNK